MASGYDITDHKRSRELLERSEAQLHAIIDNSSVVLFVKDLEGRFTLTNRGFDDTFRIDRGFAIGKTDADFFPPEVVAQNRASDQLVQAAHAARLLGAEVVLTGVRPATARTLVALGVDMRGIQARSTLDQGVAHAIARSGRRAGPAAPPRQA